MKKRNNLSKASSVSSARKIVATAAAGMLAASMASPAMSAFAEEPVTGESQTGDSNEDTQPEEEQNQTESENENSENTENEENSEEQAGADEASYTSVKALLKLKEWSRYEPVYASLSNGEGEPMLIDAEDDMDGDAEDGTDAEDADGETPENGGAEENRQGGADDGSEVPEAGDDADNEDQEAESSGAYEFDVVIYDVSEDGTRTEIAKHTTDISHIIYKGADNADAEITEDLSNGDAYLDIDFSIEEGVSAPVGHRYELGLIGLDVYDTESIQRLEDEDEADLTLDFAGTMKCARTTNLCEMMDIAFDNFHAVSAGILMEEVKIGIAHSSMEVEKSDWMGLTLDFKVKCGDEVVYQETSDALEYTDTHIYFDIPDEDFDIYLGKEYTIELSTEHTVQFAEGGNYTVDMGYGLFVADGVEVGTIYGKSYADMQPVELDPFGGLAIKSDIALAAGEGKDKVDAFGFDGVGDEKTWTMEQTVEDGKYSDYVLLGEDDKVTVHEPGDYTFTLKHAPVTLYANGDNYAKVEGFTGTIRYHVKPNGTIQTAYGFDVDDIKGITWDEENKTLTLGTHNVVYKPVDSWDIQKGALKALAEAGSALVILDGNGNIVWENTAWIDSDNESVVEFHPCVSESGMAKEDAVWDATHPENYTYALKDAPAGIKLKTEKNEDVLAPAKLSITATVNPKIESVEFDDLDDYFNQRPSENMEIGLYANGEKVDSIEISPDGKLAEEEGEDEGSIEELARSFYHIFSMAVRDAELDGIMPIMFGPHDMFDEDGEKIDYKMKMELPANYETDVDENGYLVLSEGNKLIMRLAMASKPVKVIWDESIAEDARTEKIEVKVSYGEDGVLDTFIDTEKGILVLPKHIDGAEAAYGDDIALKDAPEYTIERGTEPGEFLIKPAKTEEETPGEGEENGNGEGNGEGENDDENGGETEDGRGEDNENGGNGGENAGDGTGDGGENKAPEGDEEQENAGGSEGQDGDKTGDESDKFANTDGSEDTDGDENAEIGDSDNVSDLEDGGATISADKANEKKTDSKADGKAEDKNDKFSNTGDTLAVGGALSALIASGIAGAIAAMRRRK